jgi:ethanolamine ammonia-lyase small subunit
MTNSTDTDLPSWDALRCFTPARIGLGRSGVALPTREVLGFGLAHARARDAVHATLDVARLAADLQQAGFDSLQAHSRAPDRPTYLRRPDLGRQLDDDAAQALRERGGSCELALVVGDGLSALAVQRHAVPLLQALRERLPAARTCSPVVVVQQARVAVGDDVGEALGARLVAILIGERPGLSAPDSLGIYLTHAPRRGCHDAQRNCISNVRPEGLAYAAAAHQLAWLIEQALQRGLTGVALKDESALAQLDGGAAPLPGPPG